MGTIKFYVLAVLPHNLKNSYGTLSILSLLPILIPQTFDIECCAYNLIYTVLILMTIIHSNYRQLFDNLIHII